MINMAGKCVKYGPLSEENSKQKPLYIFYDCEAANSQITADIIEIAARCFINKSGFERGFESLISTSQELGKFTVERCGIKASDLEGKPSFNVVFNKFIKWLKKLLKRIEQKTGDSYFPVLCAHNGYGFDFPMLLSNMKRCGLKEHVLKKVNLHFADTFQFCKELQEDHLVKELQETKLSMDSLFSKFCPEKQFLNRHRAMGDVNAMIEIFSKEPFKTAINNIDYATSESLCEWFQIQYNEKEQRILLEEKMAKLDAYTRNVYSKKLFQLHLTYDGLQAIFENCCSYMDFYEALQDRGIDRKTAKHFACQFGGMGLRNQGTEPYCNLPKSAVTGDEELNYSLSNVDLLLAKEKTSERPPNVPPLPSVDDTIVCESLECWDDELDESRSFTFKVPKHVVPLSLTIDDFVSNSPSKQKISEDYPSKQNSKNLQHQSSKHDLENNGNKLGGTPEKKSTAKSNTKSNVSRKKLNSADVFRSGTSSLQIGKFPDQKDYELEKEILNQIAKVCEENSLEKDGIQKQSNDVKEMSVEDIPKTCVHSVSATHSESLGNEEQSTVKEPSQIDGMNSKKFPRKFVGKRMKKSRNNKDFYARKQSGLSKVQGNTAVLRVKRSNSKQSEESCEQKTTAVEEVENSSVLKKEISSESVSPTKSLGSKRRQHIADEECKNSNGDNAEKNVLNLNEKNAFLEENQASTSQSSYGLNESVSLQQTTETNSMASELFQNELKEFELLHDDKQKIIEKTKKEMKKTEVIHGGGQKETRILVRNKKGQKKKAKRKQHHQPVLFLNRKSIDEQQKHWPKVEIFVGDFPLHIPVEPSSVCQLQESRSEEESDMNNAESKFNPRCSAGTENQDLANPNSEHNHQSEKIAQIQNSGDEKFRVSCEEQDSCGDLETQPSDNKQVSNNDPARINNEKTVKTTDSSQQTDIDWYNEKELRKVVDQEQQTDCALLSTFNVDTSINLVHMQDKETLTDQSVSHRPTSTDTISSYCDNLSDSYGTSPCSPLYDTDSQYDINMEVFNRREYDSPARIFDISMSPHEDRYLKNDSTYPEREIEYPEENTRDLETRYLEEDTWHSEDVTGYPSPVENYKYDDFYYSRKYQRMPRADLDCNTASNLNVMPQSFPNHPCASVPSLMYPVNPNHIPTPPLFNQRFPQQYFQRPPRNTSNIPSHHYHGSFKF